MLQKSSNAEYHADRTRLSSSALKLILKDPYQYWLEYLSPNPPPKEDKPAFADGTLLHALVLEPETIATNFAIYQGFRKAGKAYEEFVQNNPGKIIVSQPQLDKVSKWYNSVSANETALELLSNGLAEHTMLGQHLDVLLKARADYINTDAGYIVDLKTTSATTDPGVFAHTVKEFSYDLSAALYCDLAHQTYHKLFDFYWIVVSKTDLGTAVYKASSATLTRGAGMVIQSLVRYKKCNSTGLWTNENHGTIINNEEIIEI